MNATEKKFIDTFLEMDKLTSLLALLLTLRMGEDWSSDRTFGDSPRRLSLAAASGP